MVCADYSEILSLASSIPLEYKVLWTFLWCSECHLSIIFKCSLTRVSPGNIYLFKVDNRNTKKSYQICSKLTIKILERRWCRSSTIIVNFEHISNLFFWYFYCWHGTGECLLAPQCSLFSTFSLQWIKQCVTQTRIQTCYFGPLFTKFPRNVTFEVLV